MKRETTRLPQALIDELNATLEPQGRRICRDCQGHPLPLNADHFPSRGNGEFRKECKPCWAAKQRAKYANDPEFRERNRENSKRNYYANHERRLAQQTKYRLANREQINAKKREHYRRNRESILAERHEAYIANPEPRHAANRRHYRQRKMRIIQRVRATTVAVQP